MTICPFLTDFLAIFLLGLSLSLSLAISLERIALAVHANLFYCVHGLCARPDHLMFAFDSEYSETIGSPRTEMTSPSILKAA